MAVKFASAEAGIDSLCTILTDVLCQHKLKINHGPEQIDRDLTQNMQDRQTQVRAGPARVVGRLRETDGMVMDRSDATAATDRWASLCIIQAEELPKAAEPWLSWTRMLFLTASLALCLSSQSDPDCLSSVLTLALLPSVGESFTKLLLVGGGGSGCPHRSEYRGRGCSAYYTSLLPLLSLSLIPCLPPFTPH